MATPKIAFENITDDQALDPRRLVVDSVIWPAPFAMDHHFRWLSRQAKIAAVKEAIVHLGLGVKLTVRNLDGADFGIANRHWVETVSITQNDWEDSFHD